jgi:HPr kinase/phosphorylase
LSVRIKGVSIPRIPVKQGFTGLPLVIAALTMTANSSAGKPSADCPKEFGNHISPTIATE